MVRRSTSPGESRPSLGHERRPSPERRSRGTERRDAREVGLGPGALARCSSTRLVGRHRGTTGGAATARSRRRSREAGPRRPPRVRDPLFASRAIPRGRRDRSTARRQDSAAADATASRDEKTRRPERRPMERQEKNGHLERAVLANPPATRDARPEWAPQIRETGGRPQGSRKARSASLEAAS